MAPYDVGAIAGIVVGCIAHPRRYSHQVWLNLNSNISFLLTLNTFIFVLPGTETGRSRRRSGKGRRRAGQRSELIGCKEMASLIIQRRVHIENHDDLFEGYILLFCTCIPQLD